MQLPDYYVKAICFIPVACSFRRTSSFGSYVNVILKYFFLFFLVRHKFS